MPDYLILYKPINSGAFVKKLPAYSLPGVKNAFA